MTMKKRILLIIAIALALAVTGVVLSITIPANEIKKSALSAIDAQIEYMRENGEQGANIYDNGWHIGYLEDLELFRKLLSNASPYIRDKLFPSLFRLPVIGHLDICGYDIGVSKYSWKFELNETGFVFDEKDDDLVFQFFSTVIHRN